MVVEIAELEMFIDSVAAKLVDSWRTRSGKSFVAYLKQNMKSSRFDMVKGAAAWQSPNKAYASLARFERASVSSMAHRMSVSNI